MGDQERLTSADAARTTDRGAGASTGERRANDMSMKDKLEMHKRIEEENQRKLEAWKAQQR